MQWFKTVKATPEKVSEAMKYYYAELEEAKKEVGTIAEGVNSVQSVYDIARKNNLKTPKNHQINLLYQFF